MDKKKISLEEIKESLGKEYIIRDQDMITIGRFTIVEKHEVNKSVLLRLKFYREEDKPLLKEALKAISKGFLREGNTFKVNIIVPENISTVPFTELGYTLEGILVNNSYQNSLITNEYLFGTDNTRFDQLREFKLLSLEGRRVTLKLASPENATDYLQYYQDNKEYLRRFEPARDKDFYTLEGQRRTISMVWPSTSASTLKMSSSGRSRYQTSSMGGSEARTLAMPFTRTLKARESCRTP